MQSSEVQRMVPQPGPVPVPLSAAALAVLEQAGPNAWFAADEFFGATINNIHTRRAYGRAVSEFLTWCVEKCALSAVTPGMAGYYLAGRSGSASTKNLALAALRRFFDCLVVRHAVFLNPFRSVRGIPNKVLEGKTAEIGTAEARLLIQSVGIETVIGLRDRAVLGLLAYTGARVGAVAGLRCTDYRGTAGNRSVRFREKGGREREIPVRHDLEQWLNCYLERAEVPEPARQAPLFRSADRNGNRLTERPLTAHLIREMLKRRLKGAGLPTIFSPHSFRVAVVTDLLRQNVHLEDVQFLAGHASPVTTRVYDRRHREVARSIVERISI